MQQRMDRRGVLHDDCVAFETGFRRTPIAAGNSHVVSNDTQLETKAHSKTLERVTIEIGDGLHDVRLSLSGRAPHEIINEQRSEVVANDTFLARLAEHLALVPCVVTRQRQIGRYRRNVAGNG